MGSRSLVLFPVLAAALTLGSSAFADVPPGTGGSTTSSTAAGAGGSTGTNNPDCTITVVMVAGKTCMECDPTSSACTALGSDYHLACTASAKSAIYCNGPDPNVPMDQNVACSVSVPGSWRGMAVGGALVVAAIALLKRRRRPS